MTWCFRSERSVNKPPDVLGVSLPSSVLPVSEVLCLESSSSSEPDPRSLSRPPFSRLLLELLSEVWDTPNLTHGGGREEERGVSVTSPTCHSTSSSSGIHLQFPTWFWI